jgi:hypothetical protein
MKGQPVRSFSGILIVGICLAMPLAPAAGRGTRSGTPLPGTSSVPPATTTSNNQSNTSVNPTVKTARPKKGVTTQVVTPPPACAGSLGSFSPAANACYGFVSGNVLDSSPTDVGIQTAALASLGLTFTNFNDYLKIIPSSPNFLDFGQPLYGDTVIGIHFGSGSSVGNSTGFFRFDFASSINGITLNIPAVSDVVLYKTSNVPTTAVPEPATWLTMLLGFGAIGFAARRRRAIQAQPA